MLADIGNRQILPFDINRSNSRNLNNNQCMSIDREHKYSIAKVRVVGFDKLEDFEKEYITENLEEGTHVYLRNEFENPENSHAIQVLRHSNLIGYVDPKMSEKVFSYLREGKIADVICSVKSRDFNLKIDLKVYYEDSHGDKDLPYHPFEGRQLSIYETEYWIGEEEWSKNWSMLFFSDELCYKFIDMYDDTVDDHVKTMVDVCFMAWVRNFLNGTCITRDGAERYLATLHGDCERVVLMKRIESYLEHKDYHFAEKELFSDIDEEGESNEVSNSEDNSPFGDAIKHYPTTYELGYMDDQGHHQRRVIKNANMNSFVAGIKFRDNYEELLSKLKEGMELQVRAEPDNKFDPNALAVYNGDDHLGYIPKRDIPAVALNLENGCTTANVYDVDEEHIDLVIPVKFQGLETMSEEQLEDFRYYKTERIKYENGYKETSSPISKEEFLEGVRCQRENL